MTRGLLVCVLAGKVTEHLSPYPQQVLISALEQATFSPDGTVDVRLTFEGKWLYWQQWLSGDFPQFILNYVAHLQNVWPDYGNTSNCGYSSFRWRFYDVLLQTADLLKRKNVKIWKDENVISSRPVNTDSLPPADAPWTVWSHCPDSFHRLLCLLSETLSTLHCCENIDHIHSNTVDARCLQSPHWVTIIFPHCVCYIQHAPTCFLACVCVCVGGGG